MVWYTRAVRSGECVHGQLSPISRFTQQAGITSLGMAKKNSTSTSSSAKKARARAQRTAGGIVAGLSALAAAGAFAAYLLYGSKHAKRNRAKVRGWMLKAKGEVIEKLEKAKEVNEEVVQTIIDQVMAKYAKLKNVGEKEAQRLREELQRHWRAAARELERTHRSRARRTTKRKGSARTSAKDAS